MKHIRNNILLMTALFSASIGYAQADASKTTAKFEALLYHIDRMYVDEVDEPDLVDKAIVRMLEELDPHSIYIPKEELEQVNEPLKGNFEGVGIQFNILRDSIFVVDAITGGPSEKLGIRAGDRIVQIEKENVASVGIKNRDVMDKLRGPKGTKVNVAIARMGEKDLLDFTITRDKIPIRSLEAAYMAAPRIGYIKVSRFSATTMKEFREEMSRLKDQGMEDLILDLQGNGGGYLRTAVNMADEFLKDNKLIVFQEGRSTPREDTYATNVGGFEKGRLVVLIDESSASASEIVAGAIQDWDRGLIIGRRSFGKGLVQRPVMLPDGSAIRLTVSRYFTPSGRCIQKPYDEGVKAYVKEKYDRLSKGELTSLDSLDIEGLEQFYTSNKRKVFGGGGIMPDVFVPIDTNMASDHYGKLVRKGVMNTFALSYVDKHRASLLKKYPSVELFREQFVVDAMLSEELKTAAVAAGIERDDEGYQKAHVLTHLRLKALIARDLWNTSAYYQVINPDNPVDNSYARALEVLQDGTFERMGLALH